MKISCSPNSERTKHELHKYIEAIKKTDLAHKVPKPVLWYPGQDLVWSFNEMGRAELRQTNELK